MEGRAKNDIFEIVSTNQGVNSDLIINCFRINIGEGSKHLGRIHDVIFLYTKSNNFTWNMQFEQYNKEYVKKIYKHIEPGTNRLYSDIKRQ